MRPIITYDRFLGSRLFGIGIIQAPYKFFMTLLRFLKHGLPSFVLRPPIIINRAAIFLFRSRSSSS